MMFIKRDGVVHIIIKSTKRADEFDTRISEKVQECYKKKCEELNLEYKPLVDIPKPYKSFDDDCGSH